MRMSEVLLLFVINLILTKHLSLSQYGIFSYCSTWINVLGLVSTLGYERLLVRENAILVHSDIPLLSRLNSQGIRQSLIVASAVAVLTGIGFSLRCLWTGADDLWLGMMISIAAIPLITFSYVRQGIMRGLRMVFRGQFSDYLIRPLLLLLFISILFYVSDSDLASSVLILNTGSYAVACLAGWWLYHRYKPVPPESEPASGPAQRIPFFFLLMNLIIITNNQLDTLMLGFFEQMSDVGIYSVANRLASFISFLLIAYNIAASPIISKLYSEGNTSLIQKMLTQSNGILSLIALPLFLGYLVFGKELLALFGPEYGEGYTALCILATGHYLNVLTGSVGSMLIMTGHERFAFYSLLSGAVFSVILNSVLVPWIGMEGSAVASVVSMVTWNMVMLYFVIRHIGLKPSVLLWMKKDVPLKK